MDGDGLGDLDPVLGYPAAAGQRLDAGRAGRIEGAPVGRVDGAGEHGVGVEKRDLMPVMFNEADLAQQQRLKCAFDEKGLLNPGKVFPTLHRCAELGRVHVHAGKLAFPDIPRF